ncbi:nucleoside triphosphate pyrophosphohydrolase [Treponema sp. OttesenSCG-928-L16]|nr:nucleoside triphosphate pyrophosphohydrolase [Treponema sp. OttesenSCG-928-L16]
MRTISYNKLVRDNIPRIIQEQGEIAVYEYLDDGRFEEELYKKLLEETDEFLKEKNLEEAADILEVLYTKLELKNIPLEEAERQRLLKHDKNGGFEGRFFLKEVKRA